jgi:hypothetical protein
LAILEKPRNIRLLWQGIVLWIVFFSETGHCEYSKVKALLWDRRHYRAVSSLLRAYL